MRKIVILILLNISILYALDLDEIIKSDDLYKESLLHIESIENNIKTAYIKKLPLKANLSTNFFGTTYEPTLNYTIGASINYSILDPSLNRELVINNQDLLLSRLKLNKIYENINYNITRTVLNYIANKNIYEGIKINYESINTYTKKVNELFNSGELSKSEKLLSDSVLLKNRAILIDSENSVEVAFKQLTNELGFIPTDQLNRDIVSQLYGPEKIEGGKKNNDLKILEFEKYKSQLTQELSKENSSFKLSASGAIKFPFDSSTSWQLGLSLSIPIFGIKLDENIRAGYSYEIESLTIQRDILEREIISKMDIIDKKLKNINKKNNLYKEALTLSEESLSGILIESNAGERTVFDVISAQNNLFDIENSIIEGENNVLLLKLEYTYLSGGLY